jgi:hypothetical protein
LPPALYKIRHVAVFCLPPSTRYATWPCFASRQPQDYSPGSCQPQDYSCGPKSECPLEDSPPARLKIRHVARKVSADLKIRCHVARKLSAGLKIRCHVAH